MKVSEIQCGFYNPSLPTFKIINEDGVVYVGNILDELIRFFVSHTQRKAVKLIQPTS